MKTQHPQNSENFPGDLPEVLADIAIGSPANVMLRVAGSIKDTEFYHRKLFAFEMAGEFINLFNKPESSRYGSTHNQLRLPLLAPSA